MSGEPVCEVCAEPGTARVCGCDGADLICHLGPCTAICTKCAVRAEAKAAAEAAPKPRDAVEPCILEVRAGCKARAADENAAARVYRLLGIDKHSRKSFVADVLIGSFENARLDGEGPIGERDDFRHLARCWTCSPPRPRCADQWCVHPRELWTLREAAAGALDLDAIAAQIRGIEKVQSRLLELVPAAAAILVERRLRNLIAVAQSAARGRAA
ncbi:MAG TPA: hypothetical protein VLW85_16700 [Myxococcales bacterium]|nr:hypothetical protein [Myxococcales bacterium]